MGNAEIENQAETAPVLAVALAVIAFLGVSTEFVPNGWLTIGSTAQASQVEPVAVADETVTANKVLSVKTVTITEEKVATPAIAAQPVMQPLTQPQAATEEATTSMSWRPTVYTPWGGWQEMPVPQAPKMPQAVAMLQPPQMPQMYRPQPAPVPQYVPQAQAYYQPAPQPQYMPQPYPYPPVAWQR